MKDKEKIKLLEKQIELLEKIIELQKPPVANPIYLSNCGTWGDCDYTTARPTGQITPTN